MTENLIIPLVHMNGSGKKNLVQGYVDAAFAISVAIKKVCEAYPHERDYYPLDNYKELFEEARKQHHARIDRLREISVELNALALGVHTQ